MNTPQRPARNAIVIAAMYGAVHVAHRGQCVAITGQADEPRSGLGLAIARVMKKNGSATSRTPSSGRRACSRRPMRVAVASRALTLGSWRPR